MKRRALVAAVVAVAFSIGWAAPALASNFGVWDGIYYADNRGHYWSSWAVFTEGKEAVYWGDMRIENTDMYTTAEGCGGSTDICQWDDYYYATWIGTAQCQKLASSTKCDQWTIRYDMADLAGNLALARVTGCHEWGHTVGLHHNEEAGAAQQDDGTCMWATADNPLLENWYGAHAAGHINGRY